MQNPPFNSELEFRVPGQRGKASKVFTLGKSLAAVKRDLDKLTGVDVALIQNGVKYEPAPTASDYAEQTGRRIQRRTMPNVVAWFIPPAIATHEQPKRTPQGTEHPLTAVAMPLPFETPPAQHHAAYMGNHCPSGYRYGREV